MIFESPDAPSLGSDIPKRVKIYYVHGTFSSAVKLKREIGVLQNRVAEGMEPDIVIESSFFDWSGALGLLNNSDDQRLGAGKALSEAIERDVAADPERTIFCVGHSHGGNVILYCYRRLSRPAQERIKGLVCLSTPFIDASLRDARSWLFLVWKPEGFGCAGLALAALGIVLASVGGGLAGTLAMCILVLSMALCIGLSSLDLINDDGRSPSNVVAELTSPAVPDDILFIAGTAVDEASFWLTAWDLLQELPFWLLRRRRFAKLALAILCANLLLVFTPGNAALLERLSCGIALAGAEALALFYWLSLCAVLGGLAKSLFLGYGGVSVRKYLSCKIATRRTPQGVSKYHGYVSDSVGGLRHSRLYRDPHAIQDTVKWIRNRA